MFFVLPIVTGLLSYDWLPNESFDVRKHEMLSSREVCRDTGVGDDCRDVAESWKDGRTGKIYTRGQFAAHAKAERYRLTYADFGYGLIACFFWGYARSREKPGSFFENFGMAVCIDIAWALFGYLELAPK